MRFRERLRKLERKIHVDKTAIVFLLPTKKDGKLFWEVQFMGKEIGVFKSREEAREVIDEQFQGKQVFLVTVARVTAADSRD